MRDLPPDKAATAMGGPMGGWNADELIGTRLGSCILESPLGVGGMGAVFLARQVRPKRQVAVKLIRPALSTDPGAWRVFLERFRREADATAALDHANIVPIYEFGEDGTMAYLVMPYLADGSLAALLAKEGRLPVRRAVSYLDQIAAALHSAHQHGIIHRDVKPSNILRHPDGRLMLADFGVARLLTRRDTPLPVGRVGGSADASLTMAGVAMGTPEYMAPELIRGEPVTPLVDIYSLGTVGYAMLAGHTPFGGGDVEAILTRQVREAPPPLRAVAPDVPPEIERVIAAALAKSPKDRPQSAKEFARMLHAAAASSLGSGNTASVGAVRGRGGSSLLDASPAGSGGGRPPSARRTEALTSLASTGFATSAPGTDATIYDGNIATGPRRALDRSSGGTPIWPSGSHATPPPGGGRRIGTLPIAGLIAAVVVLLVMAMVVGSAMGNMFSPSNGSPNTGLTGPAATKTAMSQATSNVLPTPTATLVPTNTPVPTATPVPANWLSASPTDATLGCDPSTNTVQITLTNMGSGNVHWNAQVQGSGVQLSKNRGSIASGGNITVELKNNSFAFAHSGTVIFTANNNSAGDPATVNYTTSPCY